MTDLTISPAWAAVVLTATINILLAFVGVGRQLFASKADLAAHRDECAKMHADQRSATEAVDKMLRAEFSGQIAESNRAVMHEFRRLASKVERLLVRTAVLGERTSHSDEDDTEFTP